MGGHAWTLTGRVRGCLRGKFVHRGFRCSHLDTDRAPPRTSTTMHNHTPDFFFPYMPDHLHVISEDEEREKKKQ